jgi:hypothetical protein
VRLLYLLYCRADDSKEGRAAEHSGERVEFAEGGYDLTGSTRVGGWFCLGRNESEGSWKAKEEL